MRIVYFTNSRIPSQTASSIQVMQMCQSLSKLGHKLILFATRGENPLISADINDFDYYGVEKCFEIRKLKWSQHRVGYLQNLQPIMSFLCRQRQNIDVIYGRSIQSLLIATRLGFPVIYEIHTPPSSKLRSSAEQLLFRSKHLRHLVFISGALRRRYQELFPKELSALESIIAHDGAIANVYTGNPKLPLTNGKDTLSAGYFGSLYPGKGAELIASIAIKLRTWEFHIFGGTTQEFEMLCEAKCPPNVTCHGYIPPSEVPQYQSSLDVLLLPAQKRTTIQGKGNIADWMSPLKMFEYMAAGKPIVASDLEVLREVLIDGVNSILVPPGDIDKWVEALNFIESEPSLAASLATNARTMFIEEYSWHRRAEKVLNLKVDSNGLF
jgi:glycosyltransferase involved in cell wall biosynthesis